MAVQLQTMVGAFFGPAGANHAQGLVPDPGATAHSPAWMLGDDGKFHNSSLGFNVQDFGATGNGSTDDTSAIQSAISALVSNGSGTLYFPNGTYLISSALAIPSSTRVTGNGWNSIIKGAASFATYTPFTPAQPAYFLLTNNNYGSGNTDITIDNITFDFSLNSSGSTHCIHLRNVTRSHTYACKFVGGNDGIAHTASSDYSVEGCYAIGQSNCGIDQWDGCTDGTIVGNMVDCQNVTGSFGILLTGITTTLTANTSKRMTVVGNTVRNCKLIGIWAQGGGAGSIQDSVISGNTVDTIGTLGIRVSEALRVIVSNNNISNTQNQGIGSIGESVSSGVDCVISGNTVNNTSLSGSGSFNAIDIGFGSSNVDVIGNIINGSNHAYAISLNAGAGFTFVEGNICTAGVTGTIQFGAGASGTIINNPGYNPVGVTAAANVGASPATITAGPSPETHYLIQTATNTATVAKGGKQIATLANASTYYVVELGPNESYVVTWLTTQPTYTKDVH